MNERRVRYVIYVVIFLVFPFFISVTPVSAGADLKAAILDVIATIAVIVPPFCYLIGAFMIFGGLKRLTEGNSSPHGGKGGMGKIIAGACLLQINTIYGVLKMTIDPILKLANGGNVNINLTGGTANSGTTDAINLTSGYIINALMAVAFITGAVYIGKGIFTLSHSESGGRSSPFDAWKQVVVGVMLLGFGVALGVAKSTIKATVGSAAPPV